MLWCLRVGCYRAEWCDFDPVLCARIASYPPLEIAELATERSYKQVISWETSYIPIIKRFCAAYLLPILQLRYIWTSFATMSTTTTTVQPAITLQAEEPAKQHREPLSLSGALDQFKHEETTPVIGREYVDVNLVNDIINAENSEELIRDLAITSRLYRSLLMASGLIIM